MRGASAVAERIFFGSCCSFIGGAQSWLSLAATTLWLRTKTQPTVTIVFISIQWFSASSSGRDGFVDPYIQLANASNSPQELNACSGFEPKDGFPTTRTAMTFIGAA